MNEIIAYQATEAAIAELVVKYKDAVFDVVTVEGMYLAKAAYKDINTHNIILEAARVYEKAESLAYGRRVDSEAKRIAEKLDALRLPIKAQIETETKRIEREREEKVRAEQERIEAEQRAIREAQEKKLAEERAEIAQKQEEIRKAEAESRAKIEAEERAARLAREEADCIARQTREAEEAKAKAVRDAEESRLRAEREALDKSRREQEERERAERAMVEAKERRAREEADREAQSARSEIQGIQQQVIIAQAGRLGVRVGGTIQCIEETLAETEALEIDHLGAFTEAAAKAKESAVASIRALLAEAKSKTKQREIEHQQMELADARGMLVLFLERYGKLKEFAEVVKAIKALPKERKAA